MDVGRGRVGELESAEDTGSGGSNSACLLGSFSARSHLLMVRDRSTPAPLLGSLGSSMSSAPVALVLTHMVLAAVLGDKRSDNLPSPVLFTGGGLSLSWN